MKANNTSKSAKVCTHHGEGMAKMHVTKSRKK
jgi:hypothetical protein